MKTTFKILVIIISVIMFSCSADEKIINSPEDNWRLLISSSDNPGSLMLYQEPEGLLSIQDVYQTNNGKLLQAKVERIAEYGSNLFLFMPSIYKIEIIGNSDFKTKAVLDYSTSNKIPSGICFPNATDCYICFKNDSTVDLIDLTNFKIARTIKVGKFPVNLQVAENQIYVANSGDNTVSVIDSRTHEVTAVFPVAPNPYFVEVSYDKETALVVSLGSGKLDSTEAKTAATGTLFNVKTKSIIKTFNIGTSDKDAISQFPLGLTVTERTWGFIPTRTNLLRVNTKTGDVTSLGKTEYKSAFYNYKRDELIIVRVRTGRNEYYTADPISAAIRKNIILPSNYLTMIPLAD